MSQITQARTAVQSTQVFLNSRLQNATSIPVDSKTPVTIPLIDIGRSFDGKLSSRLAVASQIDHACRTIGFFQILNHGINPDACSGILQQAKRFFHDLPLSKRKILHIEKSALFRGWEPSGFTNVNPDDWKTGNDSSEKTGANSNGSSGYGTGRETKEAFNWGYEDSLDPTGGDGKYVELDGTRPSASHGNVWPCEDDLPGFRAGIGEYYGEVLQLARHLFRLFALGLGLEEGYFDKMVTHPGGIGRLLFYPPAGEKQNRANGNGERGNGSKQEELGLGAHTDYECFTLLLSSDNPGLEVLAPPRDENGQLYWITVPVRPDCLTVNVADFFMRWTNGVYKSTVHRVINRDSEKERYSVPFFFSVNYEEVVKTLPGCLKEGEEELYPPICAGEYVLERLKATINEDESQVA